MSQFQYTLYRKKVATRFVVNDNFVGIEAANVIPSTMNDENPRYEWESKIILSLTTDEIGKFLLMFRGQTPEVSLFHTSAGGSKTLKAKRMDNNNVLFSMDHTLPDGTKRNVSGISLFPENMIVIDELFVSGIFALTMVKRGPPNV